MLIPLISISVILLIAVIFVFLKYKKYQKRWLTLQEKFKDVISVDDEIAKQKEKLSVLANEFQTEKDKYKFTFLKLDEEYTKSKSLFEELKKEISLLEETSELHSFGLYQPHYSFITSSEYQEKLDAIYDKQKDAIKNDSAIICHTEWTVSGSKSEGRKMTRHYSKIMLRAFNGECDSSISKVKWNNANTMEERIKKAFDNINKLGTTHNISITNEYLKLKLEELWLSHELQEKIYKEKEEQRRIQGQIREEEKVQREIEQANQDAEEEEVRYQKALDKAKSEIEKAKGQELQALNDKLKELEEKLKQVQELKQRALSRAQMTKSGNVYIISNIGSFGENVFKIGMTRRLEPMDRVKELSDASVPFVFDVHAMIYSDDAPSLEKKLQDHFENTRINLVNDRKEFFKVSIEEIKKFAVENNVTVIISELAEAREYNESKAIRESIKNKPAEVVEEKYPEKLVNVSALGL